MSATVGNDSSGATFSDDRLYRYALWRVWGDLFRPKGFVNFILLNPSTADEKRSDPTVTRCVLRARQWGYTGLLVTNLFAYRATDPRELKQVLDPVGPENDKVILERAAQAALIVCGWGNHGAYGGRSRRVRQLLSIDGMRLHALGFNRSGEPEHPLYLPNARKPQPMGVAA